jgi:hypothetical protein
LPEKFELKEEKTMKFIKTALVAMLLLLNLVFASPALADAGKFKKTPEYAEVTQAIADLTNPEKTSGIAPEAIGPVLADLRFQKYILETSEERARCQNKTDKTLAIYAKPKKTQATPSLYYLGAGKSTDDDFECVGIYLPGGSKIAANPLTSEELTDAKAFKFVPGTQLVATNNPETGVVEINVPAAKSFKTGEIDWAIPTLTQTDIDAQTPNAPID